MNFFKNRTVIGVICILLALIICFAVTPLFNKAISDKTEIVRVVKPVKIGEEITADKVSVVEVGAYNLPEDVVRNLDTALEGLLPQIWQWAIISSHPRLRRNPLLKTPTSIT